MQHPIQFSKRDKVLFFRTLQQRVNAYFNENKIKKTGNWIMYLKTTGILTGYFVPYALLFAGVFSGWGIVLLYVLMGFAVSGIGLCIMHDANHGAYSSNKTVNKILSYSLNMVGGSSFTWKIQHNLLHHTYTNVYHIDEDIDDKPFLRLSPHGKLKSHHRFQHYYAFLLYCFATLSWVIIKDFRQLKLYNKEGLTENNGFHPKREAIIMIVSKIVYFLHILVLPIAIGLSVGYVLLGFLLLHMVAGLLITVVFQLAHVVEGPEHLDAEDAVEGQLENTWAIHQLQSTANFSTKSKFVTWCVGGLNFQIEHHLFPTICHVHYPKIAQIVKQTVTEFNLPYYEFDYLHKAVGSHIKMLRAFGSGNPGLVNS